MTLRTALYSMVTNDAGVAALIGTRFYWRQLPEAVSYPACRYMIVSSERRTAHDGYAGLETSSIQIDVISDTSASCRAVSAALRAALDGVKDATYGIKSMRTNELDEFEESANLWRIVLEFLIHYAEPAGD